MRCKQWRNLRGNLAPYIGAAIGDREFRLMEFLNFAIDDPEQIRLSNAV